MSEKYIKNHFLDIKKYACAIEERIDDTACSLKTVLENNACYLNQCREYGCEYILIDDSYKIETDIQYQCATMLP